VRDGLANGFSYFMDERDKEWLDKNNEEARGEGTSAQGAISSASGTRTSARSAKAKGKEPDLNQPVVISEDEFELVMGLFEKVTHEKTEFLHHVRSPLYPTMCTLLNDFIIQSLETGPFPAFSEYQDVFASPLTAATFATFYVPTWIPQPQQLLRIARTVYPYWKERRIERAGHRIIPTLNVRSGSSSYIPTSDHFNSSTNPIRPMNPTSASDDARSKPFARPGKHK
jgi:enhancer of polycomb-like protein